MKIGIITYYDVTNYGSALQAYAMQTYLEALGHEVVFLQYDRRPVVKGDEKKSLFRYIRRFSPGAVKMRSQERKKVKSVKEFRDQHFVIGDYFDKQEGLDCILVGSDQIFDCRYEFYNYQYAVGVKCDHIFSYAPAFGEFSFELLENFEHRDALEQALKNFKCHSARDENTKKIIEKILGQEITRVLDPTLLYGFEKEKSEWNERVVKDDYVLIYTWGGMTTTKEFSDSVLQFAKNNALKIVSVGDRRNWADHNFADASPNEFFALVRNSSMVITNMFHGTCFTIINERPFYSVVMPHNKNKLFDLLHFLGLDSQILYDVKQIAELGIPQVDYIKTNARLTEQQKISDEYCRKSLIV